MIEVQYRKNLMGSIAAGAMGSNAHFANVLAAFFIATGQDVAQVVEGSMGMTTIERAADGGVLASIFMPDVPLGVVGGGTALATQSEALALLGAEVDADNPGARLDAAGRDPRRHRAGGRDLADGGLHLGRSGRGPRAAGPWQRRRLSSGRRAPWSPSPHPAS